MKSTYIRLAGPLQSWALPSVTGNFVRSQHVPRISALQGLVAGAHGFIRGQWPEWIYQLSFDVRVDRRGHMVDDFHTITPHEDERQFRSRLLSAMGKRPNDKMLKLTPDAQKGTSIVRRTYLADAEFLVRITPSADAPSLDFLNSPVFSTYLGRKAFAPSFPFYLGEGDAELLNLIPKYVPKSSGAHGLTSGSTFLHELRADSSEDNENLSFTKKITVPVETTRSAWLEKTAELFGAGNEVVTVTRVDFWDNTTSLT
ncbi:type I-E CRISPR-associated protein Cas5/CasD [Corynebacterium sp. sy017]|uniref:type I-E CRISPR-associated protein Cas5/CasD n=1 Tax=unclassified Corynebacterium TaxID=2624378 RepID=UPI001185AD40|nr:MULTISPECIES: type I-E CRISPR-associated protein Cas5/CasD [unclassified Corynebacterium]MBP3088481.1 type I-E CRISPR-associated protein Cas5/CasD [Corynebacterium sp. sy017]TSD91789.1 type I-E CRISPR-associated protein Cas5/CasD [Corynebacterium sp. SY003]